MRSIPNQLVVKGFIDEYGRSGSAGDSCRYAYLKIDDKKIVNVVAADDYINAALESALKGEQEVELALSRSHVESWLLVSLKRTSSGELFRSMTNYPIASSITFGQYWFGVLATITFLTIIGSVWGYLSDSYSIGVHAFYASLLISALLPIKHIRNVLSAAAIFRKQRDALGTDCAEEVY